MFTCFCAAGGDPAPREGNHHLQAVLQELELMHSTGRQPHTFSFYTFDIVYLYCTVLAGPVLDGKICDATFL